MEKQNLRAYFFQNMYLSGIHAGIQSQHTTAEMFVKYGDYSDDDCDTLMLWEWAMEHKTTIVLNGGMSGDLTEIEKLLHTSDNPYPWAYFKESEYALEGAITNVGIILPEKIYNAPKTLEDFLKHAEEHNFTEFEKSLSLLLQSKKLFGA